MPSHHRPCRDPARGSPDRLALDRRADPHDQLCRDPQARAQGGAAAGEGRHQARRPRRHHGLEHLAASGGLVRHPRHRRGLPHRQSAAVCRPDLLDRQSCRGSHDVCRSDVPADPGEIRPRAENHRALCRADRCSAHAGDDAEERRRLRGMDRRGRRRFRLEELRRKHRGRHVLHLGHHRPSQGRALLAPLQRAAFDDGGDAGRDERLLARCGAAGGADVPRQLLGPRAHLAACWAPAW